MNAIRHNPYETKPETPNQKPKTGPSPKPALSLGGIKKKTAKTETAKPTLPDANGELGLMIDRIRKRREQIEGLESAVAIDCQEIATRAFPHYLERNAGRHEPENSFLIASPSGPGLIMFAARYPKITESEATLRALNPLLGDHTGEYFKTSHSIKVECDAIPLEKQQEIVNDIIELFERYACGDALSTEEVCKPIKEFHAARHRILTVEQNAALEKLFPIQKAVKTEGVKG